MPQRRSPSRPLLPALLLGLPWLLPGAAAAQGAQTLLTRAERTGFRETSRYDEVVAFAREVAARHPDIHLTTFGYSFEGRPLPLLVVGKVADASPEAVRASGKTRVYVQGGIHAGEICGKEALLILLRGLTEGRYAHWADSLVLLIAPLYNPDGNERVNLRNRPRQNGPVGGMGTRANAQDLDLNRDQTKLDAPESRALLRLYTQYDPHVSVDLHTTNGTRHGYHLTYAPPLSPNTPADIDGLLRERWLPEITRQVKAKHGWDMYYFGDVSGGRGGEEQGWYTFDHRPRFVSNYIGLRNRFGILGEAFAYATFEDRIKISGWFVEEILEFSWRNAAEIRDRAARADARSLVGDSLAVQAVVQRSAQPVTILLGAVEEERNPFSGETMLRRREVQTPTPMHEFGTFAPSERARVPQGYLLPPGTGPAQREIQALVERLTAHGLRTAVLEEPVTMEVEAFQVDSTRMEERAYQLRQAQTAWGAYRTETRTLPAGTAWVPMDQPLARVAFTLLEPRSDDGFVAWGFLPQTLKAGEPYPVFRAPPGSIPGGLPGLPGSR
jgi:hypothetical protein